MDPPVDHGGQSYKGNQRLNNKVAILSGSDSGIGRAVAIAFAREGADLVLSYLPEEEKDPQETVRWVEQAGRRALTAPGDIRDAAYSKQLVEMTSREFGGIDIVVNNAAFQRTSKKITDVPADEFATTFQTDVFGMFYLSQSALPKIRSRQGRRQAGQSRERSCTRPRVDASDPLHHAGRKSEKLRQKFCF